MIGSSKKLLMGAAGVSGGEPTWEFDPDDLVFVYNTRLSSGTTVAVPLKEPVDVSVDWGDGSSEDFTTGGTKSHTYTSDGFYLVQISGSLQGFGNTDVQENLLRCLSFGTLGMTDLDRAFQNCGNLIEVPTALPPNVNRMFNAFNGASVFNGDISGWDVSEISGFGNFFFRAFNFNQDISGWDLSAATDMSGMFREASSFNQDISGWSIYVQDVTNMLRMFMDATSFNQDLSGWVTGLTSQPTQFSLGANATFSNNANGLKPFLADGVTQINT